MDPNLIIDDDYVTGVGSDSETRGNALEGILDQYLTILHWRHISAVYRF